MTRKPRRPRRHRRSSYGYAPYVWAIGITGLALAWVVVIWIGLQVIRPFTGR